MYYYRSIYDLISYDTKLKHSAYPKIIKFLESKNIHSKFEFSLDTQENGYAKIELKELSSFITGENDKNKNRLQIPIYSEEFITQLKKILS